MPSVASKQTSEVQNNASHLILKLLGQTTLHLIVTLCTGFQSMLESNTKNSSLCFGAVTSTGPAYLSDLLKIRMKRERERGGNEGV